MSRVRPTWDELTSNERRILSGLRSAPFDPAALPDRMKIADDKRVGTDCLSLSLYLAGIMEVEEWLHPYCTPWILPHVEHLLEVPVAYFSGVIPDGTTVVSLMESNSLHHWFHSAYVTDAAESQLLHRPGDNQAMRPVALDDMLQGYDAFDSRLFFYKNRE